MLIRHKRNALKHEESAHRIGHMSVLIQKRRLEHGFDCFFVFKIYVFKCILMKFIDFDQKSKGIPFVLWSRVPLKSTLSRYFVKLSGFHKTSDMYTVLAIIYYLCILMKWKDLIVFWFRIADWNKTLNIVWYKIADVKVRGHPRRSAWSFLPKKLVHRFQIFLMDQRFETFFNFPYVEPYR